MCFFFPSWNYREGKVHKRDEMFTYQRNTGQSASKIIIRSEVTAVASESFKCV